MSFERPTLTALLRQARADLRDAVGGGAILRSSPLAILAKVASGLVHGVYGYLDWIARQAVPATATGVHLIAWAALVGVIRKGEASATGSATFTGTPGAILAEGTRLSRAADGVSYLTTAIGTVGGVGTVTVPVAAEQPGSAGNAPAGAELVISGSASGVNATGALATAAAGGADEEAEEDFRTRMLDRYRAPPQGGAAADYPLWALEVPGVTRAWAAPNGAGAGTVVVYVMLDDVRASFGGFPQGTGGVAAAEPRGIPATGDQLVVADRIHPLRPATALVHVVAPTAYPVNLTIADLSADDSGIRAAITDALRGMFRRTAAPGGTIYQSDLVAAIDGVPGVGRFSLLSPVASLTAPAGALPVLGTITWPA
ncbi:baseplate J/gp47 family protein [Falsiroseomonas sp. CW058]|uniref:baseplate J/gp47 family protein n=1 Tax=Falsiroseomonas sp. CW058 TaxID=3388664 RepID=UPI003D311CC7